MPRPYNRPKPPLIASQASSVASLLSQLVCTVSAKLGLRIMFSPVGAQVVDIIRRTYTVPLPTTVTGKPIGGIGASSS